MNEDNKIISNYNTFLAKHDLPETFCLYPWTHVDFDESGDILSCCRGKNSFGDWKKSEFSSQEWSENISNLRDSIMSGKWHPNCSDCQKKESVGNQSLRHDLAIHAIRNIGIDAIENEIIPNIKEKNDDIRFVEIRPSNVCNLQCIHCNDKASSKWASFYKNNPKFVEENKIIPETSRFLSTSGFENVKDFLSGLTKLRTVHFCGGEPLYDKDALNYLKIIQNPQNVRLSYSTNGQTLPNQKIFKEWQKFEEVTLSISIDASGDQYDYFRYPGKWSTLVNNISFIKEYHPNIRINFHIPINIFTLFSIDMLVDLCEKYTIPVHYNTVHTPEQLSITVLPKELKDSLIKKFDDRLKNVKDAEILQSLKQLYLYINNYMYSADDYSSRKDSLTFYIFQLDKHRTVKILNSCPELLNYL
jgi:MoaA/NifB/PqqE/SkfB family radical SAM enzyme